MLPAPRVSWECEWKPRTDSSCERAAWLTATEYTDQEEVLRLKVKHLAELLRLSTKTIIYSGAGISTAAGIAPAARSSLDNLASDLTSDALPTFTHRALAALRHRGLLADWVQQNHDGLPQKSGAAMTTTFSVSQPHFKRYPNINMHCHCQVILRRTW